MLGDLFQFLGAYLRRRLRHIAVTVALLSAGGVLILLALALGLWAFYLWLQIELGTFAALAILGGVLALTGSILLAIAVRRGGKNGHDVVPAEPEMARAPARKRRRRNSRESALLTVLITLVVGWIVGRRTRR